MRTWHPHEYHHNHDHHDATTATDNDDDQRPPALSFGAAKKKLKDIGSFFICIFIFFFGKSFFLHVFYILVINVFCFTYVLKARGLGWAATTQNRPK
jgi:Na+/alanine symporter